MSQFAVSSFIEPPASLDLLLVESSFGIIRRKPISCCFEFVNLPSGSRLMAIQAASVHKKRTRKLQRVSLVSRVLLQHHSRNQAMHPPIETEDVLNLRPCRHFCFFDLHHHVKNGD